MAGTKRELYDEAGDLRDSPSIDHLHGAHNELMHKLFGDEWWHLAADNDATEPNPGYDNLDRIIAAVQQALADPLAVVS